MAPSLPPGPPLPVLRNLMAQWSVFSTATPSKSCTTNKLNASGLPGWINSRSVQKKTAQERWTAYHAASVINLEGPIMDEGRTPTSCWDLS